MPWQSLKDIANTSLDNKGIKKKVQGSLVISQANDIIGNFFGEQAKARARAVYWRDGVLTIAVLNSDLFAEIESQEEQFIRILNNRFSEIVVYTLRFLR
ncbi:DUF721 domain-containing protein [Candidatus Parcubacteria bacterium]|nr:MAG: DUF721 domain-containing protein [Candidatus Parcubacteria bacterium]